MIDRGKISLIGWGVGGKALRSGSASSGCGSAGSLWLFDALKVGAVPVCWGGGALVCAVPLANVFGATVGCTGCEIWCQVRGGFGLARETWSAIF